MVVELGYGYGEFRPFMNIILFYEILSLIVGGATAKSRSPFMSEIAYERCECPPSSFRVCWTNQVAVTLAKTGAQAALFKLHQLRTHHFPEPPAPVPALDFLALAAPDPNDLGSTSAHRS